MRRINNRLYYKAMDLKEQVFDYINSQLYREIAYSKVKIDINADTLDFPTYTGDDKLFYKQMKIFSKLIQDPDYFKDYIEGNMINLNILISAHNIPKSAIIKEILGEDYEPIYDEI